MKTLSKLILIFVFSLIANSQWLTAVSFADIPHLINYQGKLTDKDNKPLSDGTHSITFRIYSASTTQRQQEACSGKRPSLSLPRKAFSPVSWEE